MHAIGKLATVLVTTLALLGYLSPPASASAPFDYVEDPPAELLPADFCGDVVTFPVVEDFYSSGKEHFSIHGDGLLHITTHFRDVITFTNTENDLTFTLVTRGMGQDLKIVDNGDGTITITFKVLFHQRVYSPDGSLLFRTDGQLRARETIDTNGTLTDPSDDEPVDGTFSIVRDFVGRDDTAGRDFCEDLVIYIG